MCSDKKRDYVQVPLRESTKCGEIFDHFSKKTGGKGDASIWYGRNKPLDARKTAAHIEAESANSENLKAILERGADVNAQDCNGDTPLHLLLKNWQPDCDRHFQCIFMILEQPNRCVNIPNKNGVTPIHIAASQTEHRDAVEILLRLCPKIDLDTFKSDEDNRSARELIEKNFPDLENIPRVWKPDRENGITDYKYRLEYYLQKKKEIRFAAILNNSKKTHDFEKLRNFRDYQNYSYFQKACKIGLKKAVELLLELNFEPNDAEPGTERPIFLAAKFRHHRILSLLLSRENIDTTPNSKNETLFHGVVSGKEDGSLDCLQHLLQTNMGEINAKDNRGRTPLHVAVKFAEDDCIFALIDAGAQLDAENCYKKTPLSHISADTFKKYLDSRISSSGRPDMSETKIEYNILVNESESGHLYDMRTDLLFVMSHCSQIQHLLAHPVLSTIIFFKWKRIRLYFYFLLFFYAMFAFSFSAFVYFGENHLFRDQACCNNVSNSSSHFKLLPKEKDYVNYLKVVLLIFIATFSFGEIIQFKSNISLYMKTLENYVQVGKLITTAVCLLSNCATNSSGNAACPQINALAVLLVWFEIFFVLGNHPKLSFFLGIFWEASKFLFQFLVVHLSLIVAFVFSFYELYKNTDSPFSSVLGSILKTLTMVTGEFDLGDLPLASVGGYIIFCLFVFLVTIVLFNLLIGLAVKSTAHIEENTFLCSCIAQLPIISNFENILFNDKGLMKRLCKPFEKCLRIRKMNKHYSGAYPVLCINRRRNMFVSFTSKNSDEGRKTRLPFNLPKNIHESVVHILTNKKDENKAATDQLEALRISLETTKKSLEKELKNLKRGMLQILEKLEPNADVTKIEGEPEIEKTSTKKIKDAV